MVRRTLFGRGYCLVASTNPKYSDVLCQIKILDATFKKTRRKRFNIKTKLTRIGAFSAIEVTRMTVCEKRFLMSLVKK